MTIASELTALQTNLENAYDAVEAKGGTLPAAQNFDNLDTAINSISTGDEITATNTTGSAVSADDRVWVSGEDVYTQNFTAYGNPTITNKVITLDSSSKGISYSFTNQTLSFNNIELVCKLNFSSCSYASDTIAFMLYVGDTNNNRASIALNLGSSFYRIIGTIYPTGANPVKVSPSSGILYNFSMNSTIYVKLIINNGVMSLYGSLDGEEYTYINQASYSINTGNISYINIYGTDYSTFLTDLSECYVKIDGTTVWSPYTKTGTNYSIINDTYITSTSFTGIAQANIANNASGSVKTLLDGNGTYAPTTATKSITTNGTYTASAENAYGLSSVIVDVPSPDVWHNWKNTEYTSNFTNTYTSGSGTAVLSNNSTVLTTSVTGYAYKQLPSRITSISSIETCIKFKPKTALSLTGADFYFASILNNSNNDYGYGLTINTYDDHPGIGIAAGIGNTNAVTGAITFTVDSYIWLKVYMASSGSYLAYSTDGTNWTTKNITGTVSFSNVYGQYIAIGSIKYGMSGTLEYDLSECYVKVNGETIWTPYTESSSQCYTLTASPTTSTQVYEIPKKTSALTITTVGTGTITLSDSKVYSRNSAGDVQSPVLGTKTITSNDTYTAASDYLDGFSSVTVDVPSAPTKKYNLLDRVKDDSNNEIGTVSGFFTDANNVEYAVVCLDAQYRLGSGTWCSNTSTKIPNLPNYDGTTWGPLVSKETATFNTQTILDYCTSSGATSTACSHCRTLSFTIDGTTYYGQLPNMIELNDIIRNHTALNTADTTASDFPSRDFANTHTTWSSSQFSYMFGWTGGASGDVIQDRKNNTEFVIPVLEIPNT